MYTTRHEANAFYKEATLLASRDGQAGLDRLYRRLSLEDLWFLMTVMLGRADMNDRPGIDNDWLFDRCSEVQAEPDGYLDLWMREGYKSTIITFGLTIQDILKDPEETFGIFSVKRELAQDFLKQIKQEFETNETLKRCFPDVLYKDPERESPCWGLDKGIRVKRKASRREETVEAWGLIGSMPTGKHFGTLVFDDVVTERSVTNHDQLSKAYDAMRLAFNLGSHGGRRRMIGTRYHFNDAWGAVERDGTAKVRKYAGTANGKVDGPPVFLSREALDKKWQEQGSYIFACQILQDPKADEAQGFKREWIRAWEPKPEFWRKMNIYILVDPSGERKMKLTGHDYTSMWVVGMAPDKRRYVIDGLRDRINLTERCKKLFSFVRTYNPISVGYEQYGMQADIAHIEAEQIRLNYHFDIVPLGGSTPKNDRIRWMVPEFEHGRIFTPGYLTIRDHSGAYRDIMQEFVDEEYLPFPVAAHDDMMDCLARSMDPDLNAVFPGTDEYVVHRGGYPNAPQVDVSHGVFDYDPLAQVVGA